MPGWRAFGSRSRLVRSAPRRPRVDAPGRFESSESDCPAFVATGVCNGGAGYGSKRAPSAGAAAAWGPAARIPVRDR